MKLINHSKQISTKIVMLFICLVTVFLFSCTTEELDGNSDLMNQKLESADLKGGIHFETWQDQVERLTKKTRRFHNFQVALAQGWDTQATGHVPGMGIHYINEDLMDDKFEMEKPESLLYVETDEGMTFVAVEYLIVGLSPEGPAPEGFIGDTDVWVYNPAVEAWTLHVWVGLENSNGIFAPTNPDVDSL
tara:strand:+ start:682 stop:1251 length:570 start_codon:yes stop_codon:yes gene_type:complete